MLKKIYNFLFKEDSFASWVVNIILALIVIQFIIYPSLTAITGSALPVVAVVSGSMEHKGVGVCGEEINGICIDRNSEWLEMCGVRVDKKYFLLTEFWDTCGSYYESNNITYEQFTSFPFARGFDTGDVMFIKKYEPDELRIGDVVIFISNTGKPIIHRIISFNNTTDDFLFTTKGDHNQFSNPGPSDREIDITYDEYVGSAVFRVPYVGYVKIYFEVMVHFIQNFFK